MALGAYRTANSQLFIRPVVGLGRAEPGCGEGDLRANSILTGLDSEPPSNWGDQTNDVEVFL